MKKATVAIIGSFKKDYQLVLGVREVFQKAGYEVVFPAVSSIVKEQIDFVRFRSDDPKLSDPQVEQVALAKILTADFVYVQVTDGYVGRTVCYEIGRLLANDRPVYFSEKPADLPIEIPKSHILAPKKLIAELAVKPVAPLRDSFAPKSQKFEMAITNGATLPDYQTLVARLVVERGYDKETVAEVFTLLVEEVGELAKAIRKANGQKVHLDSKVYEIGEEAADVFWLLVDICNRLGIDLEQAFYDKEVKNQKRKRA